MNRVFGARLQPRGSAVIIAMVLVLLFAGLSVVLMNEMISRSLRVQIAEEDLLAFEAAEAGIDAAVNDINQSQTVRLLVDGSNPPVFTTDLAPGVPPTWPAPTGAWQQVYSNDNLSGSGDLGHHPIYVHQWFYDPNGKWGAVDPTTWVRPGCLGTRFWKPGTSTQESSLLKVPGLVYCSPTNANFTPRDNLIPSGPLGSDYISRPMWKSVPTATFGASNALTGTPMAHEDYITPLCLGDTAFFSYAIDWLHDGRNNCPFASYPAGMQTVDDASERNKYTVYSTGIHLGQRRAGISEYGTTVTVEVTLNARDYNSPVAQTGPLEIFP
jgi:hypothetical protein